MIHEQHGFDESKYRRSLEFQFISLLILYWVMSNIPLAYLQKMKRKQQLRHPVAAIPQECAKRESKRSRKRTIGVSEAPFYARTHLHDEMLASILVQRPNRDAKASEPSTTEVPRPPATDNYPRHLMVALQGLYLYNIRWKFASGTVSSASCGGLTIWIPGEPAVHIMIQTLLLPLPSTPRHLSKTATATTTSPRPDVPGILPAGSGSSGEHHNGTGAGAYLCSSKTYTPFEWDGLEGSYMITGMKHCQDLNSKRRGFEFRFARRNLEFLPVDLRSEKPGEEPLTTTICIGRHPSPTAQAQGQITIIVPVHLTPPAPPGSKFGENAPDFEYHVLSQSAFNPTHTVPPRTRHLATLLRSVKVRSALYELHRPSCADVVNGVFQAMREGFLEREVTVDETRKGLAQVRS
ncbi:hypothetical protein BV22DRAFT_1123734 [Leucogyrophana mollusca]|uniref:Uncharacterized protein n=1 Tax=Leucogyrophana mollusca TaxID=85980 RepID=A0ACB8B195_9AGAM|nr:hypothetical protein BV22DRAFT_1123734 [Leucogyrophana mollusca]